MALVYKQKCLAVVVYKLNGVGSVGAFFSAESLIEHCQVAR